MTDLPDLPRDLFAMMSQLSFNAEISVPEPPAQPLALTVRVDLRGAKPPIWRRLQLRGDLTLNQVHDLLQAAMGWQNSHLHRFLPPKGLAPPGAYFLSDFDLSDRATGTPEAAVRLDQLLRQVDDSFDYEYDFGAGWRHLIRVEQVAPADPQTPPAVCLKAKGMCPPEDIGDIRTWNGLVEELQKDPSRIPWADHPELAQYHKRLPPDLDPHVVDVEAINNDLRLVMTPREKLISTVLAPTAGVIATPTLAELVDLARPELLRALAARAEAAWQEPHQPSPGDVQIATAPWHAILSQAEGRGIRLTEAGWMAPVHCERIIAMSEIPIPYGKGNRENSTPLLQRLRAQCTKMQLIRKNAGRLVLTQRGYGALNDAGALVAALRDLWLDSERVPSTRDQHLCALLLVASLTSVSTNPQRRFQDLPEQIASLMTLAGWSGEQGYIEPFQLIPAQSLIDGLGLNDGGRRAWLAPMLAREILWQR